MVRSSTDRRILPVRIRLAVIAVAASFGILASGALVWNTSDAAFTAVTTDTGNSFSAASVTLTDDDSGGVVFSASDLVPGSSDTACITVSYTSAVQAAGVRLYATGYSDTGGLAANVTWNVSEGSGGSYPDCAAPTGTSIYSGNLAAFAAAATSYATGVYVSGAGAWRPVGTNQTKVYRFAYSVGANAPMSSSSALTLTWEAQVA